MYPKQKKALNRITAIRNTLINCRFPSTSSNSPSSFFATLASAFRLLLGDAIQRQVQRREYIDWERKHNRGVLLGADLHQRLKVTQLDCGGLLGHHLGGHGELFGGDVFALGMNDLGPALAFG